MTRLPTCPHCQGMAIPSWQRYVTPKRLKCRTCGQRSRVGSPIRTPSTSRMRLFSLVGLPVIMNLLFVAIATIVVRAPFLIWPSVPVLVVVLWFDTRGPLVAVPPEKATMSAADAAAAVGATLRAMLPLVLGLMITSESARWLAPHVRAWLQR